MLAESGKQQKGATTPNLFRDYLIKSFDPRSREGGDATVCSQSLLRMVFRSTLP